MKIHILTLLCFLFSVKTVSASEVYYVHSDHLGSTSVITNESGEVVQSDYYYPFGSSRSPSLPTTHDSQPPITEHQFTSQISDENETGLYYYNARYYNPQIAKFTQADFVDNQLNRYMYVSNNPVINIDPSGHAFCPIGDYVCNLVIRVLSEIRLQIKTNGDFQKEQLFLPETFVPSNLISLKDVGLTTFGKRAVDLQLNKNAAKLLKSFYIESEKLGYQLVITSAYRSYQEQMGLNELVSETSALAGQSQHQLGIAVDIYILDEDGKIKLLPKELIKLAKDYGIVQPWKRDDPPHFLVLNALSSDSDINYYQLFNDVGYDKDFIDLITPILNKIPEENARTSLLGGR